MTRFAWLRRRSGLWAAITDLPLAVLDALRWFVTRRPWVVVGFWLVVASLVATTAPNLTRLAAEGQARLLPRGIESIRAGDWVAKTWPEYAFDSMAALALQRRGGLTKADHDYALRLSKRFESSDKPANLLRVLGPTARKEISDQLTSADGTVELLLIEFKTSLVVPATDRAVQALKKRADEPGLERPAGLELLWTGDAVIGGDYMRNVQASLDRAAVVTVVLLLIVLLIVYRSFLLAMVPLTTIGISLVVSRGVLGWLASRGWELSPLVELFLIAVLFGSGTDFCLFVSWRFGEHWNPVNPAAAMRLTLRRAIIALLTSAGTVIVSLALMGVNRFKLFSSTGPSVALGLLITLAATLTLTPALLVLLAKFRPRSFAGITSPPSGLWDRIAVAVLARPKLFWVGTIALMLPLVWLGSKTEFLQDLFAEMPADTKSLAHLKSVSEKFDPGALAPLTVVLASDRDLRDSEGLALIDDVSRYLTRQRSILSVRSATQPLGSAKPLEEARISSRIESVSKGFGQISTGARKLNEGLSEGATKLRALLLLEELAGLSSAGSENSKTAPAPPPSDAGPKPKAAPAAIPRISPELRRATGNLLLGSGASALLNLSTAGLNANHKQAQPIEKKGEDSRAKLLEQLTRAAQGAGQIAAGSQRAQRELALILQDKVGQRALDKLLVRADTLKEHPELLESFRAYVSPNGKKARFDASQRERVFSTNALRSVERLRTQLNEYLAETEGPHVHAYLAGPNPGASDVQKLTEADQHRIWVIVPLAVFVVLLLALRDLGACINLVATMLLSYAFALGVTHLVFVTLLGAEGLDWKVPYFLFVLLVAVGVDYNVFLMTRLQEEAAIVGLKQGTRRAIAQTGGLITSAAAITACSFASFMFSPLSSLRQLGFALVVGIAIDAVLVRPILVPCGHWLLNRDKTDLAVRPRPRPRPVSIDSELNELVGVSD